MIPLCLGSKDRPIVQLTYRARLLSTEQQASEKLTSYVESRVLSGISESLQTSYTHSNLVLITMDSCPTKIEYTADMLCGFETVAIPTSATTQGSLPEEGVSTIILIAALLAEFVALTTVFLVIALATTCFMKARKRW